MPDRENVIKGLEDSFANQGCGYMDGVGELYAVSGEDLQNAIAMLKEQEAVKPRVSTVEQRCGNCNKVIEMDGWKACPWCGKPILWEGR